MVRTRGANLVCKLLSCRRSGPLRVREGSRCFACMLEYYEGGQQRLEEHDYWPRLLVTYSALTGQGKKWVFLPPMDSSEVQPLQNPEYGA